MQAFSTIFLFAILGLAAGFQPMSSFTTSSTTMTTTTSTTTLFFNNPFDKFVKGMESGYAGGEDSQYAKIKERDNEKRDAARTAAEEKRARGFKLFRDVDVKNKKFVETKYEQVDKEDAIDKLAKDARDKGPGFKFPWEK